MGEVGGDGDAVGLEESDDGRASEGKVAHFIALGDRGVGGVGLVNGTDPDGTDGEDENITEVRGAEDGELALVRPEPGEAVAEAVGRDAREGAGNADGGLRGAGDGEVVAVVVYRAEAGEQECAVCVACCQLRIAEEGREVKGLPFDEYALCL